MSEKERCGQKRTTAFCPDCGSPVGDVCNIVGLLKHCRSNQHALGWVKWKEWADELERLIGASQEKIDAMLLTGLLKHSRFNQRVMQVQMERAEERLADGKASERELHLRRANWVKWTAWANKLENLIEASQKSK